MTDRQVFRLFGTLFLVFACLFAGRAGWAIDHRNGAAEVLACCSLSALSLALGILLWAMKGGDDGVD